MITKQVYLLSVSRYGLIGLSKLTSLLYFIPYQGMFITWLFTVILSYWYAYKYWYPQTRSPQIVLLNIWTFIIISGPDVIVFPYWDYQTLGHLPGVLAASLPGCLPNFYSYVNICSPRETTFMPLYFLYIWSWCYSISLLRFSNTWTFVRLLGS